MNFNELILKRESCRAFSGESVSKDDLTLIVDAGRFSPSARNRQPWDFYVVSGNKTDDVRKAVQFYGGNLFTDKAAAFVAVVKNEVESNIPSNLPQRNFVECDLGMAMVSMAYQAADIGLGTCILGMFNEDMIKSAVGIDGDTRTVKLVLAIGVPESKSVRTKMRRDADDVAHFVD